MAYRPLVPGTILAHRYRIEQLIKAGGFAAVYVATDTHQNKLCAVKETFDQSSDGEEQFRLEADILAKIRHPNLPAVWDYFQYGNGLYLVMEYIDGDDLESRLDDIKRLPEDDARNWAIQLCDALVALHNHIPPIIHRDIKPANVKITSDYRAVLVDFGIAKLFQAGNNTQIAARAVTDGFSPLEQYGQGTTNERSDIYSLGATMYNLLTGLIPPDAPSRVPEDILLKPSQIVPTISPMLEDIVLKAMHMNPQQRFQTALEMQRALLSAIRRQGAVSHGWAATGNLARKQSDSQKTWWCTACQARNHIDVGFCEHCGAPAPTIEMLLPTRIIPQEELMPGFVASGATNHNIQNRPEKNSQSIDAAWEIMAVPPGDIITSVAGRPGQGFVACGARGLVLAHNNDSWVPLPIATTNTLLAAATAPGHVWVVGEHGTVMHFAGNKWYMLQNAVDETFSTIALDSPYDGWIAGSGGVLMELREQALEPQPMRRGQIRSIALDDVGDGWAVGDSSLLLRLSRGAWKTLSHTTGWGDLFGVDHQRPGEAWIVGAHGLLLHVDEAGWNMGPDLQLPTLRSVAFNRKGEGWAVGDYGTLVWFNGETWTIPSHQAPVRVTLRSVAWHNDDEAWAVGEQGVILRWRRA